MKKREHRPISILRRAYTEGTNHGDHATSAHQPENAPAPQQRCHERTRRHMRPLRNHSRNRRRSSLSFSGCPRRVVPCFVVTLVGTKERSRDRVRCAPYEISMRSARRRSGFAGEDGNRGWEDGVGARSSLHFSRWMSLERVPRVHGLPSTCSRTCSL